MQINKQVRAKGRKDAALERERGSGIRLYHLVAQTLRKEILDGMYPVGCQLPTEDDLQRRFSVSRFTVREATRRLREAGIVRSRQGTPAVVVLPAAPSESFVHHSASISDLIALAATTRFEVEAAKLVGIDPNLADKLGVPCGDEWLFAGGYRYAQDIEAPVAFARYYINREYAAIGRLLHAYNGPIFSPIEVMFAVSIAQVEQEIGAISLSLSLAERFRVNPELAALEITRTFRLEDGKIAQITINTYPACRFRHAMTMRRIKG